MFAVPVIHQLERQMLLDDGNVVKEIGEASLQLNLEANGIHRDILASWSSYQLEVFAKRYFWKSRASIL